MWKIDFLLGKLPSWMVPAYKRTVQEHTFRNLETNATLTGYAATGAQARYAALSTGINTALLAGQIQNTDPMPSPVWDVAGETHNLTVGQFIATVLMYMAGLGSVESQYAGYASQIASATTTDQLNALVFA